MPSSAVSRRSALRLVSGIGLGGFIFMDQASQTGGWADHAGDMRAIEIEWLRYTDAAGAELGQIRPTSMLDITNHNSLATPDGQRDLWLNLRIRNTGAADLVAGPTAFALWAISGFLYRPHDLFVRADGDDQRVLVRLHEPKAYLFVTGDLLIADPIAPRAERFGGITFRVPAETWFAGLLFTPEPDRVLVLADFRRTASVIID